MAVEKKAWRISRFGTILLSKEIRDALWCVMRITLQGTRGPSYYSRERIPVQTVHGWITLRDSDGFVTQDDFDWRFDKQRFLLWEDKAYTITVNQCFIANQQTEVLLEELVKKPNIPPLPPTIPPGDYQGFFGKVPIMIHGIDAIAIKTRLDADFDVELIWEPRDESRCSPVPIDFPRGSAPLEDALPKPGEDGQIAPPPYFTPPVFPPGSPPLGGTAFIPEGFPPGEQSSPPNQPPEFPPGATQTQLFLEYTNAFAGGGACTLPRVKGLVLQVPGLRRLNEFSITDQFPPQPGGPCGSTKYNKNISLDGVVLATGITEFSTIGFVFTVGYV